MARQNVIVLRWEGPKLLKLLAESQEDALLNAANKLLAAAKAKAPVRTGALRDSGYVKNSQSSTYHKQKGYKKEAGVSKGQALVGFAAFYALMVENGTRHAAARPYLRPAFDELRGTMGKNIATDMGKAL